MYRKTYGNNTCPITATLSKRLVIHDILQLTNSTKKKEELAEVSISINDIEEEKSEAMAGFKERLKPLNETKKHILDDVKKGSEFVEGECFKFIDHKNKTIGYYDKLGILVSSRAIMPQEMQKTIFNLKTGTNE